MIDLFNEIDFSEEIAKEQIMKRFIQEAAKNIAKQQSDTLRKIKKPVFDEQLENHLIITGIPNIQNKEQLFVRFFREKILDSKKVGQKNGLVTIEVGKKKVGEKYVYNQTLYMIYKTAADAKKAYQKLNNLMFDKKNKLTLECFTVKEFHEVENIETHFNKPKCLSNKEMLSFNFQDGHIDQFIFREKRPDTNKVYVNWFDYIEKTPKSALGSDESIDIPEKVINKIVWSSRGSYAALCLNDGVVLFGGQRMEKKGFYHHKGVLDVIFSPNETYMVSFNGNDSFSKSTENFILWAVKEEIKLKSFRAQPNQDLHSFQWCQDQSKMAYTFGHELIIYSCQEVLQLMEKELLLSEQQLYERNQLIKTPNIQKISWLSDNKTILIVCYELDPNLQSNPSNKIYFYNTETKEEKKWRAIGQHIKKAEIALSNHNDWAAVSFKKIYKKNQSTTTIQIFNLLKKDLEAENIEIKENVGNIAWDKQYGRFALTCQDPQHAKSIHIKYNVIFYQIQTKDRNQTAVKVGDIQGTLANRVALTQNGLYFSTYNISPESSGRGKFSIGYLIKENKSKKYKMELIKDKIDVAYMTHFSIDPSGRFLMLGSENSYQIWSFAGEMVCKDIFTQNITDVQFRPRYERLLPREEQKKIQQNMKEIESRFHLIDDKKINSIKYQREEEKKRKRESFHSYLQKKRAWFAPFKQKRQKILGFNEISVKEDFYQHLERL